MWKLIINQMNFPLLSVLLIDMREYTFKQRTTKASTRAFRFICFPTVDFRVCEKS